MKHRRYIIIGILCVLASMNMHAQVKGENNPYVDDKIVHFGFFLGLDLAGFGVQAARPDSIDARSSLLNGGATVGFITDLRLCRYLNLRLCPGMHFGGKSINYKINNGKTEQVDLLSIPVTIPLQLKWSAEREGNYRPYVMAGGGISYDIGRAIDKALVLQKPFDYFVEVGFGCDLYFRWFKFCPELKYQIGFANVLTPISEAEKYNWHPSTEDYWYTNALSRLTNQTISLIFNFE